MCNIMLFISYTKNKILMVTLIAIKLWNKAKVYVVLKGQVIVRKIR